jgi:hypothetical protein
MIKRSKRDICYQCNYQISKKEDLYYIIVSIDRQAISKRTCYLDLCESCFHSNMDDKIINRLKELSNGNKVFEDSDSLQKVVKNWKKCPYCDQTLQYGSIKSNFQISEILGSDLNTVAIHGKCYFANIGIPEECFHD